jgi:hypothetical protein
LTLCFGRPLELAEIPLLVVALQLLNLDKLHGGHSNVPTFVSTRQHKQVVGELLQESSQTASGGAFLCSAVSHFGGVGIAALHFR